MDPIAEDYFPPMPARLEETGLNVKFVSGLLFRSMYLLGLETNVAIAHQLRLGQGIVDDLLGKLKQQGFIEIKGFEGADSRVARYSLTTAARDLAVESARQCEYVGPLPVPLAQYQEQVLRQSLANEQISMERLASALSHLVLPTSVIRRLGPAVNSGQSLLIYGPPGNGKSSISEAIGRAFSQPIFIPYCVEVDGQVIRVYDPTVHEEIREERSGMGDYRALLKKRPDPRWTRCRRPVVVTGGELTLEMLDLDFDQTAKFYEAPPQMKAIGGVFIIDDFGRQLVRPKDLLNRWIIPLERRVDYLKLHTGKKFDVPFDELVIFSTNLAPRELMDPGLMRRVKYKLHLDPPSMADYVTIFQGVCRQKGMDLPDDILSWLLEEFYPCHGGSCAAFHPAFIVEHAEATCRYMGREPRLTKDLVADALENLFLVERAPGASAPGSAPVRAERAS